MNLFRMPSLGADMDEGTLVEWLKRPGDKISRGDVVAVVETQKGAIEIESFQEGVLGKYLVETGIKVAVGTPLAELDGEPGAAVEKAPAPRTAPAAGAPAPVPAPEMPQVVPARAIGATKASPAARKLAAERGIDLTVISGTGPDGAIVFVDVERALQVPQPAKAQAKGPAGANLAEMRKAIGAAMARSKREIPHYYLSHAVSLSPSQSWLEQTNASRDPVDRILMGALLIKATAKSVAHMPEFNGFFVDGAYRHSEAIHVGTAVSIRGGGLIAPAIHDADELSLDEIMAKLRNLVARVRAGRLRGSEIADPTITISSLGDRGVDALYGVIHPPQVALIGFGTPRSQPWVMNGAVAVQSVATVTLAADHRVSDGHRGALFLTKIADLLGAPEAL